MNKHAALVSLVTFLFLIVGPQAKATDGISVMTQNQYLGGDLGLLLTATDAASFNDALVAVLQQIAGNKFAERARRLAADIAKRQPHLVGLQEVWAFACIDLSEPAEDQGCDNPTIADAFMDHLPETLAALAEEDVSYNAVATVKNIDLAGLPFQIGGFPALFVAIDRDVILARSDVEAIPVDFACARPSVDGCNYGVVLEVPFPIGSITVERGFVAVDMTIGDQDYRFANTHLEVLQPDPTNPFSRVVQSLQAGELIQTLGATLPPGRSLIVVGDVNSSPEDTDILGGFAPPPYRQFVAASYTDAWTFRPDANRGFTCCQLADLSNQQSVLDQRIDMIFARDLLLNVKQPRVVSATVSDKTVPAGLGIWPSDHGGVVADLVF